MKLRRKLLGLSQSALASALGVTFQQVQKYEKGTNRMGASRLLVLANILQVTPAFLFAQEEDGRSIGAPQNLIETDKITSFLATREGLEINRAFVSIASPKTRRSIVALVVALSHEKSAGDQPDDLQDIEGIATAPNVQFL
ncbi:helix-turn-helix transcriptional regulator [Aliirhizobium smilacinae]|uniref:Helix-turn-helix transcriptional regulator n=2 Tax=Aliirhizobium smilacinae TaxID=1395944 RepID=A0A5C4XVJ7_9HYPH|nr:helix-turn-helix transcriptional regulator [Rhizobium smilacinae]